MTVEGLEGWFRAYRSVVHLPAAAAHFPGIEMAKEGFFGRGAFWFWAVFPTRIPTHMRLPHQEFGKGGFALPFRKRLQILRLDVFVHDFHDGGLHR